LYPKPSGNQVMGWNHGDCAFFFELSYLVFESEKMAEKLCEFTKIVVDEGL